MEKRALMEGEQEKNRDGKRTAIERGRCSRGHGWIEIRNGNRQMEKDRWKKDMPKMKRAGMEKRAIQEDDA